MIGHILNKLGLMVLVLCGCGSPESPTQHPSHLTFGDGRLSFDIPSDYNQSHDENGSIAVKSQSAPDIELHIDVQELNDPANPDAKAQSFVRFQAEEIGATVHEQGSAIYFVEHGKFDAGGQSTHWQVAIGDFLVTMTCAVDSRNTREPTAQRVAALSFAIIDSMALP